MEEKYKKFLQFSWKDSNEWLSYFGNIFPVPPGNKVERYKRKFYKLKIDSDFDIDYQPTTNDSSTGSGSGTGNQYQQQQNYYSPPPPAVPSPLMNIETMILLLFAISLPFNFHSIKLVSLAYLIRTFRICGKPQWNTQYAQTLLTNEAFHLLINSLLLMVDRFNYFLVLPIAMRVLVDVVDNVTVMKIAALAPVMKYCDVMSRRRQEIIICKANVEVANGFLMIIGIFLKLNSFILPIAYWQYMKMKYIISPDTKNSWSVLNQKVENFKRNPSVPQMVVMIIDKIQWGFQYMGKMDAPQENQQGQQQQGGSGCNIF